MSELTLWKISVGVLSVALLVANIALTNFCH